MAKRTPTLSNTARTPSLASMASALEKAGYEVYATDSTNSQVWGKDNCGSDMGLGQLRAPLQ